MLSQNTDLNLIRQMLNQLQHLVDAMEAERRHNAIQDNRLCEHESRISAMEKKYEETLKNIDKYETQIKAHETQLQACQNSVNFVEAEIPHLRYLVGRNADLETLAAFYSQD